MYNKKKLTNGEVWETLRKVDISHLVVKKGDMDYLNWADCWALLMSVYPQAIFEWIPPVFYRSSAEAGTCEVGCKVTIGELSREMSLPVMTSMLPMKSIPNPTSRDINDAKARCLVKTIAMFGLGLSLWEKKTASPTKKVEMHEEGMGF